MLISTNTDIEMDATFKKVNHYNLFLNCCIFSMRYDLGNNKQIFSIQIFKAKERNFQIQNVYGECTILTNEY